MTLILKKNNPYWIKKKGGGKMLFKPNELQRKALQKIVNDLDIKGNSKTIWIKPRQFGGTTLAELIGLDYILTHDNCLFYSMAHKEDVARDNFRDKLKFAFDNLPTVMKQFYQVELNNANQLVLSNIGSSAITGIGSRGTTPTIFHGSELGKLSKTPDKWNEFIEGSLESAESAKIAILETTADGGRGLFYEFVQSQLKDGKWDVMFFEWWLMQEYKTTVDNVDFRNEYALLAEKHNLIKTPDQLYGWTNEQFYFYYGKAKVLKEQVKSQYPNNLQEAFVSFSKTKFDISNLLETTTLEVKKVINDVNIYREPTLNQVYILAVDPSSGLSKDYTAFSLRGFYPINGKIPLYATYKGKLQENATADLVVSVAKTFGQTFVVCETNSNTAVENRIRTVHEYDQDLLYKQLVVDPQSPKNKKVPRWGFKTTSANRDLMINEYQEVIDDNLIELSNDIRDELLSIEYLESKGRYEASPGNHDDLAFAEFISYQARKYVAQEL
jgi:hypothetical protein